MSEELALHSLEGALTAALETTKILAATTNGSTARAVATRAITANIAVAHRALQAVEEGGAINESNETRVDTANAAKRERNLDNHKEGEKKTQ